MTLVLSDARFQQFATKAYGDEITVRDFWAHRRGDGRMAKKDDRAADSPTAARDEGYFSR